ncbi:MAG: hypothetical protein JNK64_04655 [Myxococcales bacterium]|nr:hypothetical protein [Myxococcales bacterium]
MSLLAAALILAACDATPAPPGADAAATDGAPAPDAQPPDAQPPDAQPLDAPGDAPPPPDAAPTRCNQLAVAGAWVDDIQLPAAPPAMTGGALIDGTYQLTAWTTYTGGGGGSGPGPFSLRQTVRFDHGTFTQVTAVLAPAQEQRGAATYATADRTLSLVSTCSTTPGGSAVMEYTASVTELRLLTTRGDLFVLTKL